MSSYYRSGAASSAAQPSSHSSYDIVTCVLIQQMSLMLKDLDTKRLFTSEIHQQETEKAFKECLEELYAHAQPEETYEWLESLPEGLEDELGTAVAQDQRLMQKDIEKMRKDPELAAFMAAFEDPSLLDQPKPRG